MQTCPSCSFDLNRDGAKFCARCGKALVIASNQVFRFCSRCGSPVEPYHPGTMPKNILQDTDYGFWWDDAQVESWDKAQPHYFCHQCNCTWRAHATDFQTTGMLCPKCNIILEMGTMFCGKCGTDLQTDMD